MLFIEAAGVKAAPESDTLASAGIRSGGDFRLPIVDVNDVLRCLCADTMVPLIVGPSVVSFWQRRLRLFRRLLRGYWSSCWSLLYCF